MGCCASSPQAAEKNQQALAKEPPKNPIVPAVAATVAMLPTVQQVRQTLLRLMPTRDELYTERDAVFEKVVAADTTSQPAPTFKTGLPVDAFGQCLAVALGLDHGTHSKLFPANCQQFAVIASACARHVAVHHSVYKNTVPPHIAAANPNSDAKGEDQEEFIEDADGPDGAGQGNTNNNPKGADDDEEFIEDADGPDGAGAGPAKKDEEEEEFIEDADGPDGPGAGAATAAVVPAAAAGAAAASKPQGGNVPTGVAAATKSGQKAPTVAVTRLLQRSDLRLTLLHVDRYYAVLEMFEQENAVALPAEASDPFRERHPLTAESLSRKFDGKVRAALRVSNWPAEGATAPTLLRLLADSRGEWTIDSDGSTPAANTNFPNANDPSVLLLVFASWASNYSLTKEPRYGEDDIASPEPVDEPPVVNPLVAPKPTDAEDTAAKRPPARPPPPVYVEEAPREPTDEELLEGAVMMYETDGTALAAHRAARWHDELRAMLPVDDERIAERRALLGLLGLRRASSSDGGAQPPSTGFSPTVLLEKPPGADAALFHARVFDNFGLIALFADAPQHATFLQDTITRQLAHFFAPSHQLPDSFLLRCYLMLLREAVTGYIAAECLIAQALTKASLDAFRLYYLQYKAFKREEFLAVAQAKRAAAQAAAVAQGATVVASDPAPAASAVALAPPVAPRPISSADFVEAFANFGTFLPDDTIRTWLQVEPRSQAERSEAATDAATSVPSSTAPVASCALSFATWRQAVNVGSLVLPMPLPEHGWAADLKQRGVPSSAAAARSGGAAAASDGPIAFAMAMHFLCDRSLRPMLPMALVWREAEALLVATPQATAAGTTSQGNPLWQDLSASTASQRSAVPLLTAPKRAVAAAPSLWPALLAYQKARSGGDLAAAEPLIYGDDVQAVIATAHPVAPLFQSWLRLVGLGNAFQRSIAKAMQLAGGRELPDPALVSASECDFFARLLHCMLDALCKTTDVTHVGWDDFESRAGLTKASGGCSNRRGSAGSRGSLDTGETPLGGDGLQSPGQKSLGGGATTQREKAGAPLKGGGDGTFQHQRSDSDGGGSQSGASVASSSLTTASAGAAGHSLARRLRPDAYLLSIPIGEGTVVKGSVGDSALRTMRGIYFPAAAGAEISTQSELERDGMWSPFYGITLEDTIHCLTLHDVLAAMAPTSNAKWTLFGGRLPCNDSEADERSRHYMWRELQMRLLQSSGVAASSTTTDGGSSGGNPPSPKDFNRIPAGSFVRFIHGRMPLQQLMLPPPPPATGGVSHQSAVNLVLTALAAAPPPSSSSANAASLSTPQRRSVVSSSHRKSSACSSDGGDLSPSSRLPQQQLCVTKENAQYVYMFLETYLQVVHGCKLTQTAGGNSTSFSRSQAITILLEMGITDPNAALALLEAGGLDRCGSKSKRSASLSSSGTAGSPTASATPQRETFAIAELAECAARQRLLQLHRKEPPRASPPRPKPSSPPSLMATAAAAFAVTHNTTSSSAEKARDAAEADAAHEQAAQELLAEESLFETQWLDSLVNRWFAIVHDEGFPMNPDLTAHEEKARCRAVYGEIAATATGAPPADIVVATVAAVIQADVTSGDVSTPRRGTHTSTLVATEGNDTATTTAGFAASPLSPRKSLIGTHALVTHDDVLRYFCQRWQTMPTLLSDMEALRRVLAAGFATVGKPIQVPQADTLPAETGGGDEGGSAPSRRAPSSIVPFPEFRRLTSFLYTFFEVASAAEQLASQQLNVDVEEKRRATRAKQDLLRNFVLSSPSPAAAVHPEEAPDDVECVTFDTYSDVWMTQEEVRALVGRFDLADPGAVPDLYDVLALSKPCDAFQVEAGAARAVSAEVFALWAARAMELQCSRGRRPGGGAAPTTGPLARHTRWSGLHHALLLDDQLDGKQKRHAAFAHADVTHRNALSIAELEVLLTEGLHIHEFIPPSHLRPVLFRAYEAAMEHRRLVVGEDAHVVVDAADAVRVAHMDKIVVAQFRHFLHYVYEYACLYFMFDTLLTGTGAAATSAPVPPPPAKGGVPASLRRGSSSKLPRKVLTRDMFIGALPTLRAWGYQKLHGKEALARAYGRMAAPTAAPSKGSGPAVAEDRGAMFNDFAEWAADEGLRVDM